MILTSFQVEYWDKLNKLWITTYNDPQPTLLQAESAQEEFRKLYPGCKTRIAKILHEVVKGSEK